MRAFEIVLAVTIVLIVVGGVIAIVVFADRTHQPPRPYEGSLKFVTVFDDMDGTVSPNQAFYYRCVVQQRTIRWCERQQRP